jgi:hypothetical protein
VWLPGEIITLQDRTQIRGYVLDTSDGFVTVLARGSSDVRIVKEELVEARVVCLPVGEEQLPSIASLIMGASDKRSAACL